MPPGSPRNRPIAEFGNLISGRAAGVQVQKSGGTTGTGTRIRIRGSNSVSLSNEPLYYIDGIRMESSATSSTLDIGGSAWVRRRGTLPDQRPESRGHRVHRDREGPGRRHALRHPGLQRRAYGSPPSGARPGKPRWNLYSELARFTTTTPTRSTSSAGTRPPRPEPTWTASAPCIRAGRPLHPDRRAASSPPLDDPSHQPAQDRIPAAVRRQRLRRHRAADLLHRRGTTRTRTASSACPGSRRTRSAPRGHRAGNPDPAQRAGAGQPPGQPRRQRHHQLRSTATSAMPRAIPGWRRTTTAPSRSPAAPRPPPTRPISRTAGSHTGADLRRADQPGHRAVYRRERPTTSGPPSGCPPGRRSGSTSPTGRPAVLPHRTEVGRKTRTTRAAARNKRFQISQTSVDLAATGRFKLSPTISSKTSWEPSSFATSPAGRR